MTAALHCSSTDTLVSAKKQYTLLLIFCTTTTVSTTVLLQIYKNWKTALNIQVCKKKDAL